MKREFFGYTKSGERAEIVTLSNDVAELRVMTRGATIVSFKPFGVDVIGGYDDLSSYESDTGSYQGATVGRVANRISDACFTMDGALYMVTDNDRGNCLHGGDGFSYKNWRIEDLTADSVTMSYFSADGEEGFPSAVFCKVTFTLRGSAVEIYYQAVPDGKTPIAMTNHSYFNLDGFGGLINEQVLTINADSYTEVGDNLIPTGERPSVKDTPFDFRSPKRIGKEFGKSVDGYDHNFIICPELCDYNEDFGLPMVASATNGKLMLNVYTDQPGVQFYTGNFLFGEPDFRGGVKKIKHGAFCLETQTEPNCINHGIGFYDLGDLYEHTTVYEVLKV